MNTQQYENTDKTTGADKTDAIAAAAIVPDTSVIIDGRISRSIREGRYRAPAGKLRVVIAEALLAELEHQANRGKGSGFSGLDELTVLQKMAEAGEIEIAFDGELPDAETIRGAADGGVDRLIRRSAMRDGCLFVTSDRVQAMAAKAHGIDTDLIKPVVKTLSFEDLAVHRFFDAATMSVHLKRDLCPMGKRGSVGNVVYEPVRKTACTLEELEKIRDELIAFAQNDPDSFIEIEGNGAVVAQIRDMRTAITEPPFSDDTEITIVRPIASVDFDRYGADDRLKKRILQKRGILIAGAPGAGKSTFAASVAAFLLESGHVVKTMESPRDLQVPRAITQYAPLNGRMENTADLLLLVRPDDTIYDEVRKTADFQIFADMRLAGVGMIGVVHATRAIDAVQRLIGRIELGVIPQVVDTVIYIDKGTVGKVYDLEFKVKVPYGMTEEDLTRPVIVVSDMMTGKSEYEIYTYGEQVVVMPVGLPADVRKPDWDMRENDVKRIISRYVRGPLEAEMISDRNIIVAVSPSDRKKLIGRNGETIRGLEASLGLRIDVRDLSRATIRRENRRMKATAARFNGNGRAADDDETTSDDEFESERDWPPSVDMMPHLPEYVVPVFEKTKKHLILQVPEYADCDVDIYIGDEPLFRAAVGRTGTVKIRADSDIACEIRDGFRNGDIITVRPLDDD